MTSLQEPAPGAKSAKFVGANPLAPMVDPFATDDNQRDVQQVLAENVNKRLERAMDELKEKHAKGTNDVDDPDRAPTGAPYRQIEQQKRQQALALRKQQELEEQENWQQEQERENLRSKVHQLEEENDNSDDEFDDLLEDNSDPVLEAMRQKRLQEMKSAQAKHAENIAKGHGQYRTITQDELLPECTGSSEWVAIHFFHKEFQRCHIMDHHLKIIAPRHITCKFVRIDAEKAPFFVDKLTIRVLPTLIVFQDGKAVKRLTGFDGLISNNSNSKDADNFSTSKLQKWLAETGAIEFDITKDELARQELLAEQRSARNHGVIWSTAQQFDDLEL